MGAWPTIPLREVLEESRDRVVVDAAGSYPVAGVYGFGRGILLREPVVGADISAGHLYRIRAGQIIYSRLKAFEGAFALVPPSADGRFVSNEFPTFNVNHTALPAFVELHLSRPSTWKQLATMITGVGGRRERLKVDDFLDFEVALPSRDEQHHVVRRAQAVKLALARARRLEVATRDFLAELREDLLVEDATWRSHEGWAVRRLDEVADVSLGFTKGRKLAGETRQLPYLRAVNVQDGFIATDDVAEIEASDADIEKFALREDDVLLLEGCGNPKLVGRAWIWDGAIPLLLHQNSTLRARVKETDHVLPRFLAHALAASPARRQCFDAMEQMSVAHLGLAGAKALQVPVPPLGEQENIVARLDEAREQLVAAVRKVESYQRLHSALLDTLLEGEVQDAALPRMRVVG